MGKRLLTCLLAAGTAAALLSGGPAGADGGSRALVACEGAHGNGPAPGFALFARSIGEAVERAPEGTTVEITGTCTESVTIETDRLSLVCTDDANIVAPASDGASATAVQIRANNVSVSGCDITGPAADGTGVLVARSGSAVLRGNHIHGLRSGVVISQASYGRVIDDNRIRGNTTGLVINNASHADVAFNDINDNGTGVLVARSAAGEFVGNRVDGNSGNGFTIVRASAAEFSRDTFFGSAPNEITNNGGHGIFCTANSAIRIGAPQTFAGNGGMDVFVVGGTQCTGP